MHCCYDIGKGLKRCHIQILCFCGCHLVFPGFCALPRGPLNRPGAPAGYLFCSNVLFVGSMVCLLTGRATETISVDRFLGIVDETTPATVFFFHEHLCYSYSGSLKRSYRVPEFAVTGANLIRTLSFAW